MQQLGKETVRLLSSSQAVASVHAVVKELVENSLDARATNIEAKLENYGLDVIEVRDNGSGISEKDAPYLALPHYTSKLACFEDLCSLQSYGFRGEAVASVAAVGGLRVTTCTAEDDLAHTYSFNHSGEVIGSKPAAMGRGTVIHVSRLFKNIPVRRQYFKSIKRCREELKKVEDVMLAFGIAHPNVRFVLKHDKCMLWQKMQTADYASNLAIVLGYSVTQHLSEISYSSPDPMVKIHCHVPIHNANTVSRPSPDRTFVYVNSRSVTVKPLVQVLRQAFVEAFPSQSGRYPVAVLHIDVHPASLDVNLEPNKTTVLLNDMEFISLTLSSMLSQLLSGPTECEEEASTASRDTCTEDTANALEDNRGGEQQQQHQQQQQEQQEQECHDAAESFTSAEAATSSSPKELQLPPAAISLRPLEGGSGGDRELLWEELESASCSSSDSGRDPYGVAAIAGCGERDSTAVPPTGSLLQWSRGELLRDSYDRPVEPVRLLQQPSRDPAPPSTTSSKPYPAPPSTTSSKPIYPAPPSTTSSKPIYPAPPSTTSSKPIYPKKSPIYDMINSRPVKRRTELPTSNQQSSPAKRQKTDKTCSVSNCSVQKTRDVAPPKDQPLLNFEPMLRSESLPFDLHNITQRALRTRSGDECSSREGRVVGYCNPPGVWLVLCDGHIACFTTARILEVQGSSVSLSSVQTLLDHTLSTATDLTSHLHTIHTLSTATDLTSHLHTIHSLGQDF